MINRKTRHSREFEFDVRVFALVMRNVHAEEPHLGFLLAEPNPALVPVHDKRTACKTNDVANGVLEAFSHTNG